MSNVLLGISGGIAAYKSACLARLLVSVGLNVRVIMTKSAEDFIGTITFKAITSNPVFMKDSSPSAISHIEWAKWADVCIIAPATADIIAKLAVGIADDPLSTTCLALSCPLIIAPAMNTQMYIHPTVCENISKLHDRGVYIIEGESGQLACKDIGKGRMAEPETLFAALQSILLTPNPTLLKGKKVVVTAGGTREFIDPVRYITNCSSGKMGYAIAEAASVAGAEVALISGKTSLQTFIKNKIEVTSAQDMAEVVLQKIRDADIIIMAAAVADYTPKTTAKQKIKKQGTIFNLELIKTIDILKRLGEIKKENQILIGFAAETENIEQNAQIKLNEKNLDIIIANDVSRSDIGFDNDDNEVILFFRNGSNKKIPKKSKRELAAEIIGLVAD